MRYLSCQHIEIDTQSQVVNNNGVSTTLAPKVYDLLLYFCQNSQRVISKDELMEQVWAGTLVTENAISRTLVKVRKVLGDDPKEPYFIVTVPRKGYRMSKVFEFTEESCFSDKKEGVGSIQVVRVEKVTTFIYVGYLLFAVTLALLMYWWLVNDKQTPLKTKQVEALTRDIGQEIFPLMSPNLQYLSYTIVEEGQPEYLAVEDLKSGEKQLIRQRDVALSRLVWSHDNNRVAFLAKSKQTCVIYQTSIDNLMHADRWNTIANCGKYSTPHLVFSPSEHVLFFNDKLTNVNGYQIFKVNLDSGQKEILNQPITAGKGNYSFDIAPNGTELVILNSEFEPKTSIYTLNLKTSELVRTGQLDYLMRSAVYHHDSLSLIHPSPHPAYELWQSALSGKKLAVLASNTARVKHVQRMNNGQDFTYVSYLLNRDIKFRARSEQGRSIRAVIDSNNSSVMDYLPAIANLSNSYVFVSKRTSNSQVYLVKEEQGVMLPPVRLTDFEQHIKLYQLAFSPEDKQLLILADNQLFLVNLETEIVKKLPLNNISIQAVSWKTEQELMFTTVKNNNWYLTQYNLNNAQLGDITRDYLGGLFIPKLRQYALLSPQNGTVRLMTETGEITNSIEMNCDPRMTARKLNLKLDGHTLVCLSQLTGQHVHVDLTTENQSKWLYQPNGIDFDFNEQGIIYTEMTQAIADVMQTRGH